MGRIQRTRGIGVKHGLHAKRGVEPHGRGHHRQRVTFVEMEASRLQGDLAPLEFTEDNPAPVAHDRLRRESQVLEGEGHPGLRLRRFGERPQSRAQHDGEFGNEGRGGLQAFSGRGQVHGGSPEARARAGA